MAYEIGQLKDEKQWSKQSKGLSKGGGGGTIC